MNKDTMPQYDLQSEMELQPKEKPKRLMITIICVLAVVVLAVTSALLVKYYVISTFIVDGISMYPTLDGGNGEFQEGNSYDERVNGEVLYLNKVAKIKRNDIVVFVPDWGLPSDNGSDRALVKRVIAVAGDRVQISEGKLYINGTLKEEPYICEPMNDAYDGLDVYIEEGNIFCMGDNRAHSADSRAYGQVSLNTVVGKCFLIKGLDGKLRTVK